MARVQIGALEPFLLAYKLVYKCTLVYDINCSDRFCLKAIVAVKVT